MEMFSTNFLAESTGAAKISKEVFKVLDPIFMILLAVIAVALIVIVLMQKSVEGNVGAISGGSSDTFYDKGKMATKERKLKITTIVLAVLLVIISILFFVLKAI